MPMNWNINKSSKRPPIVPTDENLLCGDQLFFGLGSEGTANTAESNPSNSRTDSPSGENLLCGDQLFFNLAGK